MINDLRVLIVDDQQADVILAQHALERDGLAVDCRAVASETALRSELQDFQPDVVLCDYSIPGFSGLHALETVHTLRPSTPILVISGAIPEDTAIACLERGATDYLLKSNLRRLGPAVRRAVTDTRQRRALEEQIEHLSHYDTLTGLPNLKCVGELVARSLERSRAARSLAAVVCLNLDRFRFVDESFGRTLADDLLREVSSALKAAARERDTMARVSGDEFLVVLPEVRDALQAGVLVQGLLAAVAAPRTVAGTEVRLTASAGIALYPDDGASFETLLGKAAEAMHEAKVTTQGGMQFHSGDVVRHAQQRRALETGLRNALRRNELALHFQPQYEVRTGRLCGVEALARWFRGGCDPIPPSVFVPLAEQTGLIAPLGNWALHEACRSIVGWMQRGGPSCTLAVNVSSPQICPQFTREIAAALESTGLPASQLELEITESVLIGNADAALACIADWKRLGVQVAVDDFGTGYSSLTYLSRLPVDRLKMDKGLIRGMTVDSRDATIVRAVISLGRELGFTVLAEGVETEEQLGMLAALGCQQAQGYLFAAPAAANEALAVMSRKWGARRAA